MITIANLEKLELESISLKPLPLKRPLLMIGHGTRDEDGRQTFIDFVKTYQKLDLSRPVIPCFLELTTPTIAEGVDYCIKEGFDEVSVLPILLFAARHNKFDVTNELDRSKLKYPNLKFYYGRHFGITPSIVELWQNRLAQLDQKEYNPHNIPRSDTVLLFVGRGSSDPDANGDVCKLARILWEGSGYKTVETCFIGITHPRLEEGFRRALLYQPRRIIVLPYFLFTGALVKKIYQISEEHQAKYPEVEITCLAEMGIQGELLELIREREIETHLGTVNMNCEMCKFRLSALINNPNSFHHHHDHHHHHHDHDHHDHDHHHHHSHDSTDPYAEPEKYHQRIWKVP